MSFAKRTPFRLRVQYGFILIDSWWQIVVHQYGDKCFLLFAKDAEALASVVTHLQGMGFKLKEEGP